MFSVKFRSAVAAMALPALLVAGCASHGAGESGQSTVAAVPVPSARESLDTERQRLAELFKGTPVVFVTTSDGNLRATVPRRYCFDSGSAQVRPPLVAVLDRIAKSQSGAGSRLIANVPGDPSARNVALLQDRVAHVRDHLIARGIVPTQLQVTGAPLAERFEITVLPMSPA